eukprot:scaffold987_cov197-Pinguiococcus_pyrenoidosus.AAC.1
MEAKLESLKKESTAKAGAGVKREIVYFPAGSDGANIVEELDMSLRSKGFRYGKDLIALDKLDLEEMNEKEPVGIKYLGCIPASCVGPQLLISNAQGVMARASPNAEEDGMHGKAVAASLFAFSQALAAKDLVALVRFTKTGQPQLAILRPSWRKVQASAGEDDHKLKADAVEASKAEVDPLAPLELIQVPFADDIRPWTFPGWHFEHGVATSDASETSKRKHPSQSQLDAAALLVDAFSLDANWSTARLRNPTIARFNTTLVRRGLDPSAPVETEIAAVTPDGEAYSRCAAALESLTASSRLTKDRRKRRKAFMLRARGLKTDREKGEGEAQEAEGEEVREEEAEEDTRQARPEARRKRVKQEEVVKQQGRSGSRSEISSGDAEKEKEKVKEKEDGKGREERSKKTKTTTTALTTMTATR